MSDIFQVSRVILDLVVDATGERTFFVEMEFNGGGLLKVWEAANYSEAMDALRKIAAAAGAPGVDYYSTGALR